MRKLLLFVMAFFIAFNYSSAQNIAPSTTNTSGGTYQEPGSNMQLEWSFGEMMLIDAFTSADSSLLITQGVLQPATDKTGNSPLILFFEKNDYSLFPNPTSGKFELNFFVRETGRMDLQLIDSKGAVIESRSYQYNNCCKIQYYDISKYTNGTYFVIATLTPDRRRPEDNLEVIRKSAFKVVKIAH